MSWNNALGGWDLYTNDGSKTTPSVEFSANYGRQSVETYRIPAAPHTRHPEEFLPGVNERAPKISLSPSSEYEMHHTQFNASTDAWNTSDYTFPISQTIPAPSHKKLCSIGADSERIAFAQNSRAAPMHNVSTHPNSDTFYSPSASRFVPNPALVDVRRKPAVAHDRSERLTVKCTIGATKDMSDREPEPEPHVNAPPLSTREGKGKGRALPDGRIRTQASSSRPSSRIRKNRTEVVFKHQYDPAPSVLIQEIRRLCDFNPRQPATRAGRASTLE